MFLAGGAVEEFSSIISIVISVSNERSEGAYARNETRHIIGALFSVVKEEEEGGGGEGAVKATFSESAHVAAIRALSLRTRVRRVLRDSTRSEYFSLSPETRDL